MWKARNEKPNEFWEENKFSSLNFMLQNEKL